LTSFCQPFVHQSTPINTKHHPHTVIYSAMPFTPLSLPVYLYLSFSFPGADYNFTHFSSILLSYESAHSNYRGTIELKNRL
jgi:hypothetical protein